MKKFRGSAILMIIAILGITGFQLYWLKNNYDREKQSLDITTTASFRQTILHEQAVELKLEKFNMVTIDTSNRPPGVVVTAKKQVERMMTRPDRPKEPMITIMNLIQEKLRDSLRSDSAVISMPRISIRHSDKQLPEEKDALAKKEDYPHSIDTIPFSPEAIRRIVTGPNKDGAQVIAVTIDKTTSNKSDHDTAKHFLSGLPEHGGSPTFFLDKPVSVSKEKFFQFLYQIDSLSTKDSVTTKGITKAYTTRLKEDKINVQFSVHRSDSTNADQPNAVTIGFTKPVTFTLSLDNTWAYMLNKLKLPILFSLLLIAITVFSFTLLYRNMIKQHRLGELKNEFMSNIIHELKTPIATVGVAIEALKNFNAIDDAAKTEEYLDISQNELQRLNLLVDKVLKLSVFEKKAIELKIEWFDCKQLTEEVMNSMRLQFEKYHADISLQTEGDNFTIEADKLHITSVIYNLLDNALKYSRENPVIAVKLKSKEEHIELSVTDNGIGIPPEYKGKVFEKFFRVPTGDKHNAKGYGLGLSYVSEVIKRHHGFITVDSELGKGSTFTAYIPYKDQPVIQFDEHRKIVKRTIKIG